MSADDFQHVQALAAADLAAAAAFAGLRILCELDEDATPDQLAALDADFNRELSTKGIVIMVLSPQLSLLNQIEHKRIAGEFTLVFGVCENPEVNRGAADPTATPARTPARASARGLLEAGIIALMPHFTFSAQIVGRPDFADGFIAHYAQAHRKHTMSAISRP